MTLSDMLATTAESCGRRKMDATRWKHWLAAYRLPRFRRSFLRRDLANVGGAMGAPNEAHHGANIEWGEGPGNTVQGRIHA